MRLKRALVVTVAWSLLAVGAAAQQVAITNADIVKMFKAGLSEGIVVSAIQAATSVVFELTPDGLIKLKADGVSDGALAAMMARASKDASAPPAASPLPTLAAPSTPLEVLVPENTELTLRLVRPVTSKNARAEDRVDLEVARDVVVDGYVVFRKGSPAKGTITAAANARSFGRSGNLAFSIENVEAVNGQSVRLNTSRLLKGETRAGATVAAVVLVGVFGGFVKGKNIEVPAGTEYVTYTVGDRRLNLAGVPPQALLPTTVQPQQTVPPPAPAASNVTSPVGDWKVTLPNTTATVTQGADGKLVLDVRGQYQLKGEFVSGTGTQFDGTASNACMTGRPIVMLLEGDGWTVRSDYAECSKTGLASARMSFRLFR